MKPETLQAVIFDMDGVLTATIEQHYQSWKQVTQAYGLPFSRKINEKLLGLTRRRSLEVILGDVKLPEEQMQEMLRLKNQYFLKTVQRMSPQDLMPGVAALIQELKAAGLKVAVASSSKNTGPVLSQLGIDHLMDVICDGNLGKRSKPAPDIFLYTAEQLRQEPKSCLVIEDSDSGVEAALAAGMTVVGVGPVPRLARAHRTYPALEGVHLKDLQMVHQNATSPRISPGGSAVQFAA